MLETVQITINGKALEQFSDVSLVKSIDHVGDAFSFKAPFFPDTLEYRDLFRPFKYQDVTIDFSTKRQLTGRIEKIDPMLEATTTSVSVQGRSKTGKIVDCSFPKSVFPIQFSSRV